MKKRQITDDFAAAVARLLAAGWPQERIIQEFKPDRTKHDVPAAKLRAEELGFLTKPELDLAACAAKGISSAQIDAVILGGRLTAALRVHSTSLRSILIFYPTDTTVAADFDRRLSEYAPFAARQLAEIMKRFRSRSIGVSWGLSPRMIIDALEGLMDTTDAPRKVFPLCGLPLHKHFPNRVASDSAAALHRILNGKDEPFRYSIPLVPALIPPGAENVLQDLFERYSQGYQEVFGTGRIGHRTGGLVDDVDMIVASVSAHQALGELLEADVMTWAKLGDLTELHKLVDGDIAGVLLRKKPQPHRLLDEFDHHWTGITLSDIERCATRARTNTNGSTGVCIVAIDKNKAPVILKCLLAKHRTSGHANETGLITHVICDYSLAVKLMHLARSQGIRIPGSRP